MPCPSWSTPAQACKTGSKLREIPGSVCSSCYAMKGTYRFRNVKQARERNLSVFLSVRRQEWINEIIQSIRSTGSKFFRWFDSGDLQSYDHLRSIVQVCISTPEVKHWLPTHEKGFVSRYIREHGEFPENLTVRISAAMVDGKPTRSYKFTSTVHSSRDRAIGYACPAPEQDGKCGSCRACWGKENTNVSYLAH